MSKYIQISMFTGKHLWWRPFKYSFKYEGLQLYENVTLSEMLSYKICQVLQNIIFSRSTAQKMKFSMKDFFSKCNQIRRKLRIWSYLQKKSLIENFILWPGWLPLISSNILDVSLVLLAINQMIV